MIRLIAGSIIDFKALWKIVAVSILAGAGVVGAFGFALIGISRYQSGTRRCSPGRVSTGGRGREWFCLAAVVIGLIAMTDK